MKKILIILSLVLISLNVFSQAPDTCWIADNCYLYEMDSLRQKTTHFDMSELSADDTTNITVPDADVDLGDVVERSNSIYTFEVLTCVSDTANMDTTSLTSFVVTDGGNDDNEDQIRLGDGTAGQIKYIAYKTNTDGADSFQVFMSLSGGASIVFDSVEQGVMLIFDGTNWNLISPFGTGVP